MSASLTSKATADKGGHMSPQVGYLWPYPWPYPWPRTLTYHLWLTYHFDMFGCSFSLYMPLERDFEVMWLLIHFQKSHNTHESKYSAVLPENGYLTGPTFQFLRQAFLTIYTSLLRYVRWTGHCVCICCLFVVCLFVLLSTLVYWGTFSGLVVVCVYIICCLFCLCLQQVVLLGLPVPKITFPGSGNKAGFRSDYTYT